METFQSIEINVLIRTYQRVRFNNSCGKSILLTKSRNVNLSAIAAKPDGTNTIYVLCRGSQW